MRVIEANGVNETNWLGQVVIEVDFSKLRNKFIYMVIIVIII